MVINATAGVTINAEKGTKAYGILELMQGDVIVEGISFKDHTHPNVAKGDSSTGKPHLVKQVRLWKVYLTYIKPFSLSCEHC